MTRTFFISDTHFGHANILQYEPSRLELGSTVEEMDEGLIERWNSVVRDKDVVYHVGDVAIPRRGLKCLARCNGRKKLIKGNHDIFNLKDYTEYFEDIIGVMNMPKLGWVCTHIPIYENQFYGRWRRNIHGHLHGKRVLRKDGGIDERYVNVCVEHTNYTPIDLEEVKAKYDSDE